MSLGPLMVDLGQLAALDNALFELKLVRPAAPRHIQEKVAHWAEREFRAGRAQAWLTERFEFHEWATVVASELRHAARLIGWAKVRPDLRDMTWQSLLAWTSVQLDSLAPDWDERVVLGRFPDDWTVESVRTDHDLNLEGQLMHHCLTAKCARSNDAILSLRDPTGRPHATLAVQGTEVVDAPGRSGSSLKPAYVRRLSEFCGAVGLRWEPGDLTGISRQGPLAAEEFVAA